MYRQTENQAYNQGQLETQQQLRKLEKAQVEKVFVDVSASTVGVSVSGPSWAKGLVVVKASAAVAVAVTGSGGRFNVSASGDAALTLMYV